MSDIIVLSFFQSFFSGSIGMYYLGPTGYDRLNTEAFIDFLYYILSQFTCAYYQRFIRQNPMADDKCVKYSPGTYK